MSKNDTTSFPVRCEKSIRDPVDEGEVQLRTRV